MRAIKARQTNRFTYFGFFIDFIFIFENASLISFTFNLNINTQGKFFRYILYFQNPASNNLFVVYY